MLPTMLSVASQIPKAKTEGMGRSGRSKAVKTRTATTVISRMRYAFATASPTPTNSHPSHANLARDATCLTIYASISKRVDVGI